MESRDGSFSEAMTGLANPYPRHEYRRTQVIMEHLGHFMRPGKAFRRWSKAGLQVP